MIWRDYTAHYIKLDVVNDLRNRSATALKDLAKDDFAYLPGRGYTQTHILGLGTPPDLVASAYTQTPDSCRDDFDGGFFDYPPSSLRAPTYASRQHFEVTSPNSDFAANGLGPWETLDLVQEVISATFHEVSHAVLTWLYFEKPYIQAELSKRLSLFTRVAHRILLLTRVPGFISKLFLVEEKWFFVHGTHPPDFWALVIEGLPGMRGRSMPSFAT
jgi:hypothetical protein